MDKYEAIANGLISLVTEHNMSLVEAGEPYGMSKQNVWHRIHDMPAYKIWKAQHAVEAMEAEKASPAKVDHMRAINEVGGFLDKAVKKYQKENEIDSYNAAFREYRKTRRGQNLVKRYETVRYKKDDKKRLEGLGLK